MLLFTVGVAALAGTSSLDPDRAFVVTGPSEEAWAKVYNYGRKDEFLCDTGQNPGTEFSVPPINTSRPGSSAAVWQLAYTMLEESGDPYVFFTSSSPTRVRVTTCPVKPLLNFLVQLSYPTDLFVKCNASSLAPTATPTAVPTTVPTAAPTSAPTAADYGPMTESECTDVGGSAWNEVYLDGHPDVRVVRYCCGPCTEKFKNGADENCACPASPGEAQIRNNPVTCDICANDTHILMLYCGSMSECNGTQYCPESPGAFSDACLGAHPPFYDPGPMTESDCTTAGGSAWNQVYLDGYPSIEVVRYCCGVCTERFKNGADELCACPPNSTEAQVRNNTVTCDYCNTDTEILMMYCGNTDGCNGTQSCPTAPGLYNSACTGFYPPIATTLAPTAAPTALPTEERYVSTCFVADYYNVNQCTNLPTPLEDADLQWCSRSEFLDVAQYAIHPLGVGPQGIVTEEAQATRADFDLLSAGDQATVQSTVSEWITLSESQIDNSACWCRTKSQAWFPYGPVEKVNLTGVFRTLAGRPLPHTYYSRDPSVLYYSSRGAIASRAAAFIENNGAIDLVLSDDDAYAPPATCGTGCTQVSTKLDFPPYECALVCAAPLYVGSLDVPTEAPFSILLSNATNVSACHAAPYMWISQQALLKMAHSVYWQNLADTYSVSGSHLWVPWRNLSSGDSTCTLLAENYCSLELVPYPTYESLVCSPFYTSNKAALDAINFVGVADVGTVNCTAPTTSTDLHLLIPNMTFEGTGNVSTAVLSLFWRNMAERSVGYSASALSSACTGPVSWSLTDTVTVTANVVWMERWNSTGCTGLYGCASIDAATCNLYPGCRYRTPVTETSTTTTATVPIVTLPPPVPKQAEQTYVQLESEASFAAAGVLVGLIGVSVVISAVLQRAGDRK